MAIVTLTGAVKNAIRNVPFTNETVDLALVEVFESGDIGYLTEEKTYKIDNDGEINGGGIDIVVPDSGSVNYAINLPSALVDGQEAEEVFAVDASPSTQKIEDLIYGGTAPDGGTITITGELRNPLNNQPYANALVTLTLRELFTTQDGIYPPTTSLIKVSQGLFNGEDGLVIYVPEGVASLWSFVFPDGTTINAQFATNTNLLNIGDILDGDYSELPDDMNVPTSFNAVQDGVDVDLTWVDTNSDETSYRIERSDDSGATWDAVTVTAANATSYTNTSVPADSYVYRIRAEKSGGQSAWVTDTLIISAPPIAPTSLTAVPTGAGRDDVLLTWVDNSSDETGFIVERSYNGSSWTELTTTAADIETYTDTNPDVTEVLLYYRVRAEGAGGESANATITIDGDLLSEVGRWLMNEASGNALDSIGSNPLTDGNSVGSASDGDGNYRTFDGINQWFSHADNATFSMGTGVRCTFAGWVNFDVLSGEQIVVSKRDATIEYWLRSSGSDIDFAVTSNGMVGTLTNATKAGLTTGAWFFIVAIYNGSTISVNINNGTAVTTAFSADIGDGGNLFGVGAYGGSISEPLNGSMRRLRLWKRALSPAQLTKVFNDGY